MTTRTQYQIRTKHLSHLETRTVEVCTDDTTTYVIGGGLGCSRDYHTTDPKQAVQMLLQENGMTLIEMKGSK